MKISSRVNNSPDFRQSPQAIESEGRLISSAMLGETDKVLSLTTLDDFYRRQHQVIMHAIADLYSKGQEVTLVTVTDRLRITGTLETAGGASGVARMVDCVPAAGSVEYEAYQVRQAAVRRQIIRGANDLARAAYDEPDFELLQQQACQAFKDVDRLTAGGSCFASYADLAESEPERWEKIGGKGLTGVTSGYLKIDAMTGGFQPSDLIVLAARPGMGKTAMKLNLAENAARHGCQTLIYSLEMSKGQLYARQTAKTAQVDSQKFRLGAIQPTEWQRIMEAQEELHGLPIYIDDTPRLHIAEIKRRSRYAADKLNIKFIAIDYLQLIRGDNRQARKDLEIGDITAELKGLAKELNVPILLLSQLNRGVETRDDKRPRLSDLRESGAIEQDADIVGFLYRDEYYYPNTDRPGVAELNIAKHRNGPTGTVFLEWVNWRQSFENYQGK